MNGKTPLYLTAAAAALLVAAVLTFQPYSVTSPWNVYSKPVQRYLRTALERDSLALMRQSVDPRPVAWALEAARSRPDSVAWWARKAKAWAGTRHADTADVFVSPPWSECTLVVRFVGPASTARVKDARGSCLAAR
jgi:hypothetical protein